jgi:nicotinate-nucleotide adenylyltransferase
VRFGLFGGSFDPFHLGHRAMLNAAWETGRFDRLLVMPVGTPPHKSTRISLATYRYEMARLGTKDLPFVELRDDEILLNDVAYTLRTVRHLKNALITENK